MQVSTSGGETAPVPVSLASADVYDFFPGSSELLVKGKAEGSETEWPVWILPLPGGSLRRVGNILAHAAAWAPDGQRIVYASKSSLYICNADGTDSHEFITVPGVPFAPRFSPDGRRLRFTIRNTDQRTSSLWEISSDGTNLHPVLPDWNNPAQEFGGAWTPDGEYFLFESIRDHAQNIWSIHENTSWLRNVFRKGAVEPTQLTVGPLIFSNPTLSPDGKKLFVIGQHRRFDLIRLDGKSQQFSIDLPGISAGEADLTKNGECDRLCFASRTNAVAQQSRREFANPTYLCTHAGPRAALVARWNPDRFHGVASGKALEDFCNPCRRRHAT